MTMNLKRKAMGLYPHMVRFWQKLNTHARGKYSIK
jgi:hypothetical protein